MAPNSQTPLSARDNVARGSVAPGSRQGAPPTQELGAISATTLPGWGQFAFDELEQVPELQFPMSVRTYNAMRNDSQIDGLYAGSTFPIRRYKWMIDPNGCEESRVRTLAGDLNLSIKGDNPDSPRGRSKKRFVFDDHLADALKSILFGFYYFEQVGYIGDDNLWHLRKLAPRPPITIQEIKLADDGGLLTILQNIHRVDQPYSPVPEIPVDRLVAYVWDKEGANWQGRSMLRSIYRNWLIKDRLLRVDALKHERNGMGVPWAEGAPGMTDPELMKLAKLAQSYKAGEQSGAALPSGSKLHLEGVRGTLPDTIASINMHNEEMARRFLMMFLQLGSTLHGSRALGKDFVDYFQLAQEQLANWFRAIFNEHVIEDYWDWNYGENEEHTPLLVYERDDDPRFAAADLAVLVQNDVIQVDDQIEQAIREGMDLPARTDKSERTYLSGHEPPNVAPEDGVGDQPGQPSTQPGNADPQQPDQNPATARRTSGRPAVQGTSPPEQSGVRASADRKRYRVK